jgi:hypothetical protein
MLWKSSPYHGGYDLPANSEFPRRCLPPRGVSGDGAAPEELLGRQDLILVRSTTASFDPPLVDTFAIIVRAGSRRSRPVEDFVERVSTHLQDRIAAVRVRPGQPV